MVTPSTAANSTNSSTKTRGGSRKKGPLDRANKKAGIIASNLEQLRNYLEGWLRANPSEAKVKTTLATAATAAKDARDKVANVIADIEKLAELKYVPENPGRKPRFDRGAKVRVKKEKLEEYTKRGLYNESELGNLVITVIDVRGREARAKIHGTEREIHIRSLNHLEALAA